jgi:excisionase family DNA binding protein
VFNPTTPTSRILVDYLEAAHRLSVGRTTIYGLVDRGELRTVKIGRRSLITVESLRAYVERLTGSNGEGTEPVA